MASLWKRPESKFWFACFTTRDGKRRKVSTKTTDRRAALKIANEFEDAYRNQRTAEQVQKVIRQAHEEMTGEKISDVSVKDFVRRWTEQKAAEGVAEASLKFYSHCTGRFVTWLAKDAEKPLAWVTREKLEQFRRSLAGKLSAKTVQHQIKGLRMLFRDARKEYGIENPAEFVKAARAEKGAGSLKKASFTLNELRTLVRNVEGEWKTLTLLGAYTGARLADLQFLSWENVDFTARILRFTTRKTGRDMLVPIAPALLRRLEEIGGMGSKGFVVPGLARKKSNTLSGEFTDLLRCCGLRKDTAGTSGPRRHVALSFHSLRHGVVSMLKQGGASVSVAMEFAGHDSEQMSAHYTTVSDEALRTAAESLPDLEAVAENEDFNHRRDAEEESAS
ncbi:MAG: integrase family protein [Verrucomicrobiales bacterium]|nr:integrase family protein [Verrucomicrobiales bacterium]